MFIFAGEPNSPNPPPILTSKYGSVTAGDQFYLEGLDTISWPTEHHSVFCNYDDPKSVNEKEKSQWYILLPYPIPKEQVSKLQESNNCLNTGHLQISKPPTILPCNGRETERGVLKINCALCANGCATEQKSDFKTDSTLVTETLNGQYNT